MCLKTCTLLTLHQLYIFGAWTTGSPWVEVLEKKKSLALPDYQTLVVQPVIMRSTDYRAFSTHWNGNNGTHDFICKSHGKERQIVRDRLTVTKCNYIASPVDICHITNRAGVQILITWLFPNEIYVTQVKVITSGVRKQQAYSLKMINVSPCQQYS